MVLDRSSYSMSLKRCKDLFIVETYKDSNKESEETYKFQLSTLFQILEGDQYINYRASLSKICTLDLSHSNISELPKCIKILQLKHLNLSHNNFTSIPTCLYGDGLPSLETLNLSYNQIKEFDIQPDCVLSLKRLIINNNCFQNVPKWFLTFRCINLEEFNYSENRAQHYKFLKNSRNNSFMKLKILELSNSCLIDIDVEWLKSFKMLEYLNVSNKSLLHDTKHINKFRELDSLFVQPLWNNTMKVLKLNHLDISFFPEGVLWIECLKELYINNNHLTWLPEGLEYLINLELMDVSCNELVSLPNEISQLPKLKVLNASHNRLSGLPILPHVLETLDMYNNCLDNLNGKMLENVQFMDLDFNYVNLQEVGSFDFKSYLTKRSNYRNLHHLKDRFSDTKFRNCEDSFSSSISDEVSSGSSSVEDDPETESLNEDFNYISLEPEEDWDGETEVGKINVPLHPDISLSDHEYGAEFEVCIPKQQDKEVAKVYADEEAWIFEDAD